MLRIRLAGKTDAEIIEAIRAAGLGGHLRDNGYQPHTVAVKEQKSASVLLLPLRKEPEYKAVLPGKLFEYLAAGRPVLGIGQPDGAMAIILKDTGAGTVADWNDCETMSGFIDGCWKRFQEDSPDAGTENISAYSRKNLTARMARLLDSLTGNACSRPAGEGI